MLIAMQTQSGSTSTSIDVLIWVGVLIVAVLALGIVIVAVRRRVLARDHAANDGFIEQLRRMHRSGELSTEEYDAARRSLTAKLAAGMEAAKAPVSPARPPGGARSAPAARSLPSTEPPQELHARPGFDLTGAPLPRPAPPPSPPAPPTPPASPYDRKPPP